jgi:hypothetical protein
MWNKASFERLSKSAANPLPTPFLASKIPLPDGWSQGIDLHRLFARREVIFGCRIRIFPCRQGNATKLRDTFGRGM